MPSAKKYRDPDLYKKKTEALAKARAVKKAKYEAMQAEKKAQLMSTVKIKPHSPGPGRNMSQSPRKKDLVPVKPQP